MLKHAGDNVPLPLCPQSGGGGMDCPVVGFGAAAGKENLPRLAAQGGSYLFPGKLYIPLGVSAQGINAGGIAVLPGQIGQHSLQHGPGHLCGGGVVSINHSFFHTDPSPVDFLPFYYAIRILYRISRNFARGNEKIFFYRAYRSRWATARASHRSFSGCPACPRTQTNSTRCRSSRGSSCSHRSTFSAGFLSDLIQPFRFQP